MPSATSIIVLALLAATPFAAVAWDGPALTAPAGLPTCGAGCESCVQNCGAVLANNGLCCQVASNSSCDAGGQWINSMAGCQNTEGMELCVLSDDAKASCDGDLKPQQPGRNWNPMCIGVIGGVGPQAGVDVTTKIMYQVAGLSASDDANTAGKEIPRKPYYRQGRDMPMFTLNSAPKLDGTTQNNWGWANQAEQVANIGKVLNEIDQTFPPCIRERGVVGLACNTIHDYLYESLNDTFEFVSIVKAVKDTMSKELEESGSKKAYILGSSVTMTPKGEYKALYPPFTDWNLNEGITSEKDRSYLWNNVILKVQQGQADLAHENFVKFIKKWIPEGFTGPVALSCTELPIAAVDPKTGKFVEGYNFIDPNEELARALVTRAEEVVKDKVPEMWNGYKCGVDTFIKQCCDPDQNTTCTRCCESKDCKVGPSLERLSMDQCVT